MEKKKISYWYVDGHANPEDFFVYHWLKERYDVALDEINPDFLFYDVFGDKYLRYKDSVRIFLPTEDEIPNFNRCDYGTGFVNLTYRDRYFFHNFGLDYITPAFQDRSAVTDDFVNRKFCNFIYSNAVCGEGALLRQELCKRLMKYKRVDCPGAVLNNMDRGVINDVYIGDWVTSKIQFQRQYNFTIACENDATDGWTTEKMPDAMRAYSLPIYYGNPDVTRDFNPKAFVNVADYDFDLDKVVERIIYLDTHDDEYLTMLREKPLQDDFRYFDENKFKEWVFHIIEKGRKPFNKDPRGLIEDKKMMADTSIWYRGVQGIKDTSLVGQLRDIIQAAHAFVEKDEVRYLRKKYCLRLLRYQLLKHITFGAMKKKYTEKYKKLKSRIKSGV
ncbi:MAG: hypothetical protein IJ846_06670 [Alphaproteobacteria bacterium]|nr:hypothetical protein [Alphaproteobacteria bacterium]